MDFGDAPITELAAIVAAHLQKHGISVVLVRGLAVGIYTDNIYLTQDIDLVNTNYAKPRVLSDAMARLDFYKQGRVYVNDSTPITVAFPPGPLSVGDELIHQVAQAEIVGHKVPILAVSDVVKDRLVANHLDSMNDLESALARMLLGDF